MTSGTQGNEPPVSNLSCMTRRAGILVVLLALLGLPFLTATPPAQAADGCTLGKPKAFFLAVSYDSEQREDFVLDVGNYEALLTTLKTTYCIGSTASKILAMENSWTDPHSGKTYAEGSEANVKAEIARLGGAANATPGSTFFFFLSSHGMAYSGLIMDDCPVGRVGSESALKSTRGGDNGYFSDCELGNALNTHVKQVPSFIAVDCSFCGGFSDSITHASGTVSDGSLTGASGILAPSRIVVTGCAITTECFGSSGGANPYRQFRWAVANGATNCDGWTAPGFPTVQGVNLPQRSLALDGKCGVSEVFWAAVNRTHSPFGGHVDVGEYALAVQQQYRIKYGPATPAGDIPFV